MTFVEQYLDLCLSFVAPLLQKVHDLRLSVLLSYSLFAPCQSPFTHWSIYTIIVIYKTTGPWQVGMGSGLTSLSSCGHGSQ